MGDLPLWTDNCLEIGPQSTAAQNSHSVSLHLAFGTTFLLFFPSISYGTGIWQLSIRSAFEMSVTTLGGLTTRSTRDTAPEFTSRPLRVSWVLPGYPAILIDGSASGTLGGDACCLPLLQVRSLLVTTTIFAACDLFGGGINFSFLCHSSITNFSETCLSAPKIPPLKNKKTPCRLSSMEHHPIISTTTSRPKWDGHRADRWADGGQG